MEKLTELLKLREALTAEKKAFAEQEEIYRHSIRAIEADIEIAEKAIMEEMEQDGVISQDIDIGAFNNARLVIKEAFPPLVVAEDAVPEEFLRIKAEINKKAINEVYGKSVQLPNWLTRPDKVKKLEIRFVKKA